MATEKLPEFAKNGQKNTDDLTLLDGFPVSKKPARQWFNFLFNTLSLKINEVIDGKVDYSEIIDNLTTNDAKKPLSAAQGKALQDNKLNRTSSANKQFDLGRIDFDGIHTEYTWLNSPGSNIAAAQFFRYSHDWIGKIYFNISENRIYAQSLQSGITTTEWKKIAYTDDNVASATKLATARNIAISGAVSGDADFDGSGNITINTVDNFSIGVNQTWRDVTTERLAGVTYTNTTNRTITVFFGGGRTGFPGTIFYVNGSTIVAGFGGTEPDEVFFSLPIPPLNTYKYENKPQSLFSFWELK